VQYAPSNTIVRIRQQMIVGIVLLASAVVAANLGSAPMAELGSLALLQQQGKGPVFMNHSILRDNKTAASTDGISNETKKVIVSSKRKVVPRPVKTVGNVTRKRKAANKQRRVIRKNNKTSKKSGKRRLRVLSPAQLHQRQLRAIHRCRLFSRRTRARQLRKGLRLVKAQRRLRTLRKVRMEIERREKRLVGVVGMVKVSIRRDEKLRRVMLGKIRNVAMKLKSGQTVQMQSTPKSAIKKRSMNKSRKSTPSQHRKKLMRLFLLHTTHAMRVAKFNKLSQKKAQAALQKAIRGQRRASAKPVKGLRRATATVPASFAGDEEGPTKTVNSVVSMRERTDF